MNDVRQRDFFIVLIKSSKARGDELPGKTPVCDLNLGEVCTLIIKKLDWGGGRALGHSRREIGTWLRIITSRGFDSITKM